MSTRALGILLVSGLFLGLACKDGNGGYTCFPGNEDCPCVGGVCLAGLECMQDVCVATGAGGSTAAESTGTSTGTTGEPPTSTSIGTTGDPTSTGTGTSGDATTSTGTGTSGDASTGTGTSGTDTDQTTGTTGTTGA